MASRSALIIYSNGAKNKVAELTSLFIGACTGASVGIYNMLEKCDIRNRVKNEVKHMQSTSEILLSPRNKSKSIAQVTTFIILNRMKKNIGSYAST
jgi:hypothetical protein